MPRAGRVGSKGNRASEGKGLLSAPLALSEIKYFTVGVLHIGVIFYYSQTNPVLQTCEDLSFLSDHH